MANFGVVVYGITVGDQQIGAFNAPVGAALPVWGLLRDLIQFGMEKLVLLGPVGFKSGISEATSIIIQQLF